MSTLLQRQKEIVNEFQKFSNWEDRYRHIIEMGKKLPQIEAKFKTDE